MDERIKNGDRVRDRITGLKGIVVGRTEWLYGCTRITVQPESATKDNKPAETFCVDEPQLEVLKRGVVNREPTKQSDQLSNARKERKGGPRLDVQPRPDASRERA